MRGNENSLFDRAPNYQRVYEHLAELREEFHRSGKLDDSNAKLDEVVKLFATYLAYRRGQIDHFPTVSTAARFKVSELEKAFLLASALPEYQRSDGVSIFGDKPKLGFGRGDEDLAVRLVSLAKDAVDEAFRHFAEGRSFDVLNEAFGHFVRDNFRGNVEDAQFLTPSEVVDFIIEICMTELEEQGRFDSSEPIVVADPCSGVGSFLTSFSSAYAKRGGGKPKLLLCAQDKVERMVRLSTINLSLHQSTEHTTSIGNSLFKESPLDRYNGKVDLVVTNPPFGATFTHLDVVRNCSTNTPFFSQPLKLRGPIDSELLFVDRNLRLLKEGGLLAIVVPDSVISAKGTPSLLRHHLKHTATLLAVVELPSVTFAQAGTRTKTSVIVLQKKIPVDQKSSVLMGNCRSLGFEVNSRKGVLVKTPTGSSDLPELLAAYRSTDRQNHPEARRVIQVSLRDVWTPRHYLGEELNDSSQATPLEELVTFVGDSRKARRHQSGDTYISVLHVIGDGLLDLRSAATYAPKTPGIPVHPGEILLSRINPRIPRVIVVPEISGSILCSTEFEVMKAKPGFSPYLVCFLLLSADVQQNILRKTSGTSASHNRIKTRELSSITLPLNDESRSELLHIGKTYEKSLKQMFVSLRALAEIRTLYERNV